MGLVVCFRCDALSILLLSAPLLNAQGHWHRDLPNDRLSLCFCFLSWTPVSGTHRYLVAPDEKQATFTGEQQRGGVWFMMFIVLGLFSPGTRRRPPQKKKAKGNDTSTRMPTAKSQPPRQPATAAPPPSPAPPTDSVAATNVTDGVVDAAISGVDAAISDVDKDAELDDVLASLMADIDVADGDAAEPWAAHSDGSIAASDASGASAASDSSVDSDTSATRAAAADPVVGGNGKANQEKRTKKMLNFDNAAYEAAFGSTPYHVAVTTLFVKYAELVSRLTGHQHCRALMTVAGAEEAGAMAKSFVLDYMVPILGDWFSTKVHKLLAHVIDAIKQHGALTNGDTGSNEALHGQDKRRYSRASGSDDAFRTQMLRVGQGSLEIRSRLIKEAADFDDWFVVGGSDDYEGDDAVAGNDAVPGGSGRPPVAGVGGGDRAAPQQPAIPRRALPIALDKLAERRGLGAVADALGLPSGGTLVHVSNSLTFTPRMPCCAERTENPHPLQHLRATPAYRGIPWYDGVAYRLPGEGPAVVRYGVARAIIRAVRGEVREAVVVSEMAICESTPGCPLVHAGCTRLCWSMTPGADWPSLRSLYFSDVLRLEHIVRDFDQVTQAHGITATPRTIRDCASNRRAARFFVNVFYPWP